MSQSALIPEPEDASADVRAGAALAQARLLVDGLRPRRGESPNQRLDDFVAELEADDAMRAEVTTLVHELLSGVDAVDTLASAGILGDEPLLPEILHRLARGVLPPLPQPDTLHGLIGILFHDGDDPEWIGAVPPERWRRLRELLDLCGDPTTPMSPALSLTIRIVAHRIAALGLRPVLTSRLHDDELRESPFLVLSDRTLAYVRSHGNDVSGDEAERLQQCLETLARCRGIVARLRAEKDKTGTSSELTALTFRMLGLVDRLELLLWLSDPHHLGQGDAGRLLVDLVHAEHDRRKVIQLVRQHTDLLLYQIVQHAARTGHHYITRTWPEYRRFLLASMGGGLWVAIFAAFKVKLAKLGLPLAGQALVYSLNYALCFVLIYVSGAALATKQPAVTAHALAATLDGPRRPGQLAELAERVVRVCRSQFISFVGNLAVAFPLGLVIAVAYQQATGEPFAPPAKAGRLLADLHPWQAPTLWYAAVAGVFLFSAGLIAGWVNNRLVFSQIPARIAAHPLLLGTVGEAMAQRLASFTDRKAGGIVGNVVLGFCLGSAGTLGHIVGMPFDIRHVAFGSAHFAMGLVGSEPAVSVGTTLTIALGVALIGFVNFIVSFGCALFLALESRSLGLRDDWALARLLWKRLARRPLEFFFPPPSSRQTGGGEGQTPGVSAG